MLDGVDAGIRRLDGVDAVGGDPHAEAMRLLGDDFHQVEFQKLVELDLIDTRSFFLRTALRASSAVLTMMLPRLFGCLTRLGNLTFTADRPAGIKMRGPRILPSSVPRFCAKLQGPSWKV